MMQALWIGEIIQHHNKESATRTDIEIKKLAKTLDLARDTFKIAIRRNVFRLDSLQQDDSINQVAKKSCNKLLCPRIKRPTPYG